MGAGEGARCDQRTGAHKEEPRLCVESGERLLYQESDDSKLHGILRIKGEV